MFAKTAAVVVAMILGLVSTTKAQEDTSGIYVEFYSTTNPHDGWAHAPGFPDRWATPAEAGLSSGSSITVNNANPVPYRIFAVSPTDTDIGTITFSSSAAITQLMIGTGFTQVTSAQALTGAGARNVGSIFGDGVLKLRL